MIGGVYPGEALFGGTVFLVAGGPPAINAVAVAVASASAVVTAPSSSGPQNITPTARAVSSASAFVTAGLPPAVKPYHVSATTSSRYSVVVTTPALKVTVVRS